MNGTPDNRLHFTRHQSPMAFRAGYLSTARSLILLACMFPGSTPALADDGQAPSTATASEANPPAATIAEADGLLTAGYYARAIEAYTALAAKPDLALEAGLGLARCRLETGAYGDALKTLKTLDGADSADWNYMVARVSRRVGDYNKTIEHARAALSIDGNHSGARFLLADMLEYLGRRVEAIEEYRWFDRQVTRRAELPPDAGWVTDTARGFLRYSVLTQTDVAYRTKHALGSMLQIAYERLDRTYWPARIAAADLLREKYNNDEHDGSVSDYKAALLINSHLPEAHVGLGEVMLERWDFEEVERRARLALETNPSFVPAFNLLAKNLLLERRYREAIDTCQKALQINPNDIDALSISAAAGACMYDDDHVERMGGRVRLINAKCSKFHRTLGDALAGIRQFASCEREYLQAVEFDPTDANARTELGMMYMQWGIEAKARGALEASWELDRFNERTKFTLELLEMLDDFARTETDHFIIKYDAGRDPGLGEFVAGYLEQIYPEVTGDHSTPLSEKTIIELFPTQKAFGVRVTGKPWIPTVGACTGRVIALSSPRESPELQYGPYNIARVLKHEFAHTVTLAATRNRIPHWLTEGLAVQAEEAPRSFAWCESLADAIRRDRLFTLETIDWGFARPRRPGDRQLAYAQSEWMCEYIIGRFGYDIIGEMLERFRYGWTQKRVFAELLGVETPDFDRDFAVWARGQAQVWGFDLSEVENVVKLRALALVQSESAGVYGRLARAELDEDEHERALEAARRAIELDENEINGLEVLAKALAHFIIEEPAGAGRRVYQAEALPALRRLAKADPKSWTAPKMLAAIAMSRDNNEEAIDQLVRLQQLCPMDPFSWQALGSIYLKRGLDDMALIQLLEVARTEEHDADIPGEIGKIYKRKGRLPDARYWLGSALLIDPFSVELHEVAGEVNMRIGDTAEALRNYTMLGKLESKKAKHFERAAFAAFKLGDRTSAERFARRAVQLDPNSPAATIVP